MVRSWCRFAVTLIGMSVSVAYPEVYEVGPGKQYASLAGVPIESLSAGDTVLIHWRSDPYREKFALNTGGSSDHPVCILGVPGATGALPVLDGRNAVTARPSNSYWNENRSIIKIQNDPAHIVIGNLEIRSARPPYSYTARNGSVADYATNAAAIFIESGDNITVRNCILRDCGNGLFSYTGSSNILVEGCHLYDNGIEGSIFEHNNYTSSRGITFQYNHFGRLRAGCSGNNLKDRSAGTVIRYNWIEPCNRQLDLVEEGELQDVPGYHTTIVYGNVLIEDNSGNNDIVHYGGDNGDTPTYRKGTLYFYNNTIISTRTDATRIIRLSTADESCDFRNNLVYVPDGSTRLLDGDGTLTMRNNWLMQGYQTWSSSVVDGGQNITGTAPGFVDAVREDYRLTSSSDCIDAGCAIASAVAAYPVNHEYAANRQHVVRTDNAPLDIGAFAHELATAVSTCMQSRFRSIPVGTASSQGMAPKYYDLAGRKWGRPAAGNAPVLHVSRESGPALRASAFTPTAPLSD
jgi:hypothetical protein